MGQSRGVLGGPNSDSYVTFLDKVMAWRGSCVLLPCTYSYPYGNTVNNFTWYHNAVYDKTVTDFIGTVVYNSKNNTAAGDLFAGRVQYMGTTDKDCTIMITNLQKEHEGSYGLRLRGTVVYNSKNNTAAGDLFAGRVQYMGTTDKDCTIMITNLQKEHEGSYGLRLRDSEPALKVNAPNEIKELELVTLTCSVNYYCPYYNISLFWIGDVNGTETTTIKNNTNAISTTTSLSFQPSWEDDKKNVTCIFRRNYEEEEVSETIQLDIKYAPKNVKILPNNSSITFIKGKRVTLSCTVGSSNPPDYKIHWFKNNNEKNAQFNQIKMEVSESGNYYCSAENNMGNIKSNVVEVSVLYAPDKPKIQTTPGYPGDIREGQTVTMTCSTRSNPPVSQYLWYKDGKECCKESSRQHTIYNIQIQNSGNYKCSARNDLGTAESIMLFVNIGIHTRLRAQPRDTGDEVGVVYLAMGDAGKDAPKNPSVVLDPDKTTFVEGTYATFHCVVNSSNPAVSNVAWYLNGVKKQNFPISRVIKVEDAGKYHCVAGNHIGTTWSQAVEVSVLYPPKSAHLQVSLSSIKEGTDFSLSCDAGASNPEKKSYEWHKNGIVLKTTESATMYFKAKWTDSGRYSCKAVNKIGNVASNQIDIDVKYAPRNITASIYPDHHVHENTDVKMTCTAISNSGPVTVSWFRNNKLRSSSNKYLVLLNVQLTDSGEYYCVASTDIGAAKSNTVSLQVSYSSYSIGKFVASGVSAFILLIIFIFLVVRFRIRIKDACSRKKADDMTDSTFFVLKKSHNDALDNGGQQTPSNCSSTDQLNCSNRNFSTSTRRPVITPRSETNHNDITTIYSVVKKSTPEYENIESSQNVHEESQDEIHYSEIAHLSKDVARRERGPEVEYAMLRQ
ncbi:B-cell receptor CD22 [Gastrophryne carolinensis]